MSGPHPRRGRDTDPELNPRVLLAIAVGAGVLFVIGVIVFVWLQ